MIDEVVVVSDSNIFFDLLSASLLKSSLSDLGLFLHSKIWTKWKRISLRRIMMEFSLLYLMQNGQKRFYRLQIGGFVLCTSNNLFGAKKMEYYSRYIEK